MLTLFKMGFEVVVFVLTLFAGFYIGVKCQQKWPTKVASFFSLIKL